jgi:PAS domain S-box-containing protein
VAVAWNVTAHAEGPPSAASAARATATLAAVLDATHDAVVAVDTRSRITSWNRGAERLFGRRAGEALGLALADLFPRHVRCDVDRMLDAVLTSGHPIARVETEIRRQDGMPAPIALSMSRLMPLVPPGPAGAPHLAEPIGAVAVAHDITEQRLAQARLAEVEALMREAEALVPVGRWLWDVRSGEVQWSGGFHRIHRLDPMDFEGTIEAHIACAHPDDRDRLRTAVTEAVSTARPCDLEYRIVRGDGEVAWVHARAEPTLDSAGTVAGLRGVGQDVTERHTRSDAGAAASGGSATGSPPDPAAHPNRPAPARTGA